MAKTILQAQDTSDAACCALYLAFDLGDKRWTLELSDGRHNPSRCELAAGDKAGVLDRVARAKKRFGLPESTPVYSCYEAGRDGWWLHRWLLEQGIRNDVVDSASIEVNRRSRRAKNDAIDVAKLLQMLMRHWRGERVWSVARCPSVEEEDARRDDRELARLTREKTAHTNRVRALLVLHNVRAKQVGGHGWSHWWSEQLLPAALCREVERELARLELVRKQIREIEAQRLKALEDEKQHGVVRVLHALFGIGIRSAWTLDKELFGWRQFSGRRQVGACVGLTPTPYNSGDSQVEQGISKIGTARVRCTLIELSWYWLRFQPNSELTLWFKRRFVSGGKRMRRIGIVAMARRLVISLWRYVTTGELPKGAVLRPVAA
jgi:transposase